MPILWPVKKLIMNNGVKKINVLSIFLPSSLFERNKYIPIIRGENLAIKLPKFFSSPKNPVTTVFFAALLFISLEIIQ